MHLWMLVIALAACEKSGPAPEPAPAPEREQIISALTTDTIAYTLQLPAILLAFDGDCAAHATRLLALEPLVSSIRTRSADLSADELRQIKERMGAHKAEIFGKLDAQLAEKHATRADVEAKEAATKTTCGDDPKVKDAMDRVGLYKKKT
ncbi:MAG: hypothetical protein ABI175_00125 [Polyangiales bacterium]